MLFGTYCEVHDAPDPSNTTTPQTHDAIGVVPTGNLQSMQKFWSLKTTEILVRRSFTEMPMPDWVILQVNAAGIKAKREQYGTCLTFNNINKKGFTWDTEDDLNKLMGDNSPVTHPDIPTKFPGVILESDHDGPTAEVETLVVDDKSAAVGAAANVGIQHCADDPARDKPPLLSWITIATMMIIRATTT